VLVPACSWTLPSAGSLIRSGRRDVLSSRSASSPTSKRAAAPMVPRLRPPGNRGGRRDVALVRLSPTDRRIRHPRRRDPVCEALPHDDPRETVDGDDSCARWNLSRDGLRREPIRSEAKPGTPTPPRGRSGSWGRSHCGGVPPTAKPHASSNCVGGWRWRQCSPPPSFRRLVPAERRPFTNRGDERLRRPRARGPSGGARLVTAPSTWEPRRWSSCSSRRASRRWCFRSSRTSCCCTSGRRH